MNERLHDPVEEQFETAKTMHQSGQLALAVTAYSRVLNLDPEHFKAHNNLGSALEEMGARTDAIASFRRALALAPDAPVIHYNLANALHKEGKLEAAEASYRRSLELDPSSPETHVNLATTLLEQSRLQEAAQQLRSALALYPDLVVAHSRLGHALRLSGDLDNAAAAYRAAIALEPSAATEHLQLGAVLDAQYDYQEAEACYRQALALDADLGAAYEHLGRLLTGRSRYDEAESVFRDWLEAKPNDPAARHMLAALTGTDIDGRASDDYVQQVFDSFASSFDATLAQLDYRAPQLVAALLDAADEKPEAQLDILDAGCGTGLCGPRLRLHVRRLVGVDLSSAMLDKARQRDVYDTLDRAELSAYLNETEQPFDVVVAADTFIYFGTLDAVFAGAKRVLRAGGRLIFTVETLLDESATAGFRLNHHGRYSHTEAYVADALMAAGLPAVSIGEATLRRESGRPVAGLLVLAQKPLD